jgi:GR25 family glycosyltransferase involved in LPS biosynthesis
MEALVMTYPFSIEKVDAVYPSKMHIPFAERIMSITAKRTGKALISGELGCLMSHRKVWRKIISEAIDEEQHFMVFESDSRLLDSEFMKNQAATLTAMYDMFFWGAWEGHLKLFRSSRRKCDSHIVGTPFIKTVYCTYGYSLNRKAAKLLLQRTAKPSWAVDQFKYFFKSNELKLGAVLPEVVKGNESDSTIRSGENLLLKKLFLFILDFKNNLICFFR